MVARMTSTRPKKSVLLIGLDPKVVDYSQLPGLDAHKIATGIQVGLERTIAAGFDAEWCLTGHDWASAERQIRAHLVAKSYAAVMIGAGIRIVPADMLLFENIINLIHAAAPSAKICFNVSPESTAEAVLRWIEP